ncbi:hypothetical protein Tco_0155027 [Tanacetum coccineum]
MTSMNNRLNIEKLDGNIVQNHGGSKQVKLKQLGSKQVGFKQLGHKQVGFKQLGPGVETGVHGVRVKNVFGLRWNCRELRGTVKLRFFKLVTVLLKWLKNVFGIPGQKGVEDNVAEKKKVKESMEADLRELLKYNAWLTRRSPVRGFSIG